MNRVQKAAVIIITLLLVVLGTAYGAGYFYFGSHFLPGTELNEFDVSFKTAAEVQDLLDQKVKSYAIAVEERNGGREKIDARSIGMKYKSGGTVQKLLSGQDRLLWFIPESSFEKTDLGFVLDEKLLEMAEVFHIPSASRLKYIVLPGVYPFLQSGFALALGMSWKSGVAAELIGQYKLSIGNQLYMDKITLDTAGVFAWTVVILLVSWLFEKAFLALLRLVGSRTIREGGKAEK